MNRSLLSLTRTLFAGVLAAALLTACASQAQQDDSLYQELGGTPGIERLVTALLDRIYADERIAFLFQDTDRKNLHGLIVDQICMETGGPCEYTGLSMLEAHAGMKIRHSEFDAFVEDFILAMEDVGIPYTTQNRVLAIFAPMRDEIIHK
ncbi:MAG TPA: group 1 truncated hemoglobin [Gammaproteobacteria bacterium]|nr:group 1 truncated hemoglobin [Gammaproteobacteria bacterium]